MGFIGRICIWDVGYSALVRDFVVRHIEVLVRVLLSSRQCDVMMEVASPNNYLGGMIKWWTGSEEESLYEHIPSESILTGRREARTQLLSSL